MVINGDTIYIDLSPHLTDYVKRVELQDSLQSIRFDAAVDASRIYDYVDSSISVIQFNTPEDVLTVADLTNYSSFIVYDTVPIVFDKIIMDTTQPIVGDSIWAWIIPNGDTVWHQQELFDFQNFMTWFHKNRKPIYPENHEFPWGSSVNTCTWKTE